MKQLLHIFALLTTITLGILSSSAYSQGLNKCPNSDFSLGNFTDWEGYYGYLSDPGATHGFADGRHTVFQKPGSIDPRTCGGLYTLPKGENFSAKLGNENVNSEAEQLRYRITVTNETNLFIYKYAVVLQDPGHDPSEQPSFTIEVTDNSGKIIDPVCGYYYVFAQQGLPNWHSCSENEVIWKDWTTVGIDLTPYIGQTINIVFTTRDCAQSGHYGYAYISAYCSNLQIVYGYCPNDTIATVTAPPGFSYLWGNGDKAQTTIIHNPVFGMVDSCILTSANGCKVTIKGSFKPTLVAAEFSSEPQCEGSPLPFTDLSTINQNLITNWTWDFGDGTPRVSNIQNPQHTYKTYGMYNASLIAYSTDGCPDTTTKTVEVIKIPDATFSPAHTCSRKMTNDTIYFDKQLRLEVPEGSSRYVWNTGDTTNSILVTEERWYKVEIENENLCTNADSVMLLYCYVPLSMPNAFSPNNDSKNDFFRPITQPEKVSFFVLTIFDRWGGKIYETGNSTQGWDGTIKGQPAPQGLYSYTVSYENPAGDQLKIRGLVTLIR